MTPQVLCGHRPYIDVVSDILVIDAVLSGVRPEKPKGAARLGFTNDLWRILERCWLGNRSTRPSVEEILPYLNDATLHWYLNTVTSNPPTTPAGTPGSSRMVAQPQDMCEVSGNLFRDNLVIIVRFCAPQHCQRRLKCRRGNRVFPYCGLTCAQLAQSGFIPATLPAALPMYPPTNPPVSRNSYPASSSTSFSGN